MSFDWRTWNFCEETFEKRQHGLENTCSPLFEGSVQCLSFDKLPIVSHPSNLSNLQNETSSDQCCNQQECLYEKIPTVSDASDDEQMICHQPLKKADVCIVCLSEYGFLYHLRNLFPLQFAPTIFPSFFW